MNIPCPACETIMLKPAKDPATGLHLEACPRCRGWWFDVGELERFLRSSEFRCQVEDFDRKSAASPEGRAPISGYRLLVCCKCGTAMHERVFRGIKIDVCQNCRSLWFDAGELTALMEGNASGMHEILMQRDLTSGAKMSDDAAATFIKIGEFLSFFLGSRHHHHW
ncbi:MAG: zf-TFIIB domain-containing protein [Candidatus Eremiobacteraeota bacterium]|nr:zf-TFIIB domain-containing protein [Candidatus Eremiobacteraeota bacterium]